MEYITKDVIKPVMDFVKTCPFLDKYHIDLTPAGVQKMVTAMPDGSALDYMGSVVVSDKYDIHRNRYVARQANFYLWLLRKSNHDLYRREVSDFLYNFEQWVEFCQSHGTTPKLSDTEEGKYEETMTADNGNYFSEWEDGESSLYLIQLHITYYNEYIQKF